MLSKFTALVKSIPESASSITVSIHPEWTGVHFSLDSDMSARALADELEVELKESSSGSARWLGGQRFGGGYYLTISGPFFDEVKS